MCTRGAENAGIHLQGVARLRLLQTIADLPERNVVTLGGDVHMNVAAQLRVKPNDERSPVVASEIVTTSVSSRGMSDTLLATIRDNNPAIFIESELLYNLKGEVPDEEYTIPLGVAEVKREGTDAKIGRAHV